VASILAGEAAPRVRKSESCECRARRAPADAEVEALFRESRRSDYAAIVAEARGLLDGSADGAMKTESRRALEHGHERVSRRLSAVRSIDFFDAPEALDLVVQLSSGLRDPAGSAVAASTTLDPTSFRGRTWVTREDVHVDRMASAWLIRRFIDAEAPFEFVPARTYQPSTGELRFDMLEAEFTHEGGQSTFDVQLGRTGIADPALRPIAEIVHDIDLKDGKFARPETAGIAVVLSSIVAVPRDDGDRVARAEALFDDLHAWYRTRAGGR